MNLPPIHGVVPILVTPFDEGGRVDEASLRRVVEFNISAGVHGLGIALGSEVYKLSDQERELVVGAVVAQVNGRVPVVMNTGAQSTDLAIHYSQQAESAGVAAVMCTSPGPGVASTEILHYFRSISEAIRIPVVVQDTATNHVPAPLLRSISEEAERVRYAKVESTPLPQRVYEAVQACGDRVAILGGGGGSFFLEELRRGSIGTMPWPGTPRAFVDVWDHWHAGDRDAALEVFEQQLAPLNRLGPGGLGGGQMLHKELLKRQGIIESSHVRRPVVEPDPIFWEELDEVCHRLGLNRKVGL
jgi:dihydrodipicolinate synthase/N-acetylneuraminate lyase